jgi:Uma2 family endonuclease
MVATLSPYRKKRLPVRAKDIPHYLIYEIMDGKPIYYEGFREVLTNKKTFEEIMGSSLLQSRIIAILIQYFSKLMSDEYEIFTNEFGIHIDHNDNLCGDFGIYHKSQFSEVEMTDKYTTIAPKIMIEIDTKANLEFVKENDYFYKKTEKLLDFGVERVIWYFTKSRKIMIAEKEKSWTIDDWNKNIEIMPNLNLCLTDLMAKKGITI